MSFNSYSATVNFEGMEFSLPNIYRYISRDEYGFIQAWQNKPKRDTVFGGFTGNGEMPITLGHETGENLSVVLRKYRSRRNSRAIVAITGIIEQ